MNRELIAEAIKCVKLMDIRLNSGSISRDDNFTDASDNENVVQQNRLSVTAQIMESSDPEAEDDLARVKLEFGARYAKQEVSGEDSLDKTLAEVVAEFVALYLVKRDARPEALNEFFRYNVVHNVWPFWREHLLRVTSSAGLPRLVVPLYTEMVNEELSEVNCDDDQNDSGSKVNPS